MSYKAEVIADSSGQFCENGLAFATEAEAAAYASELKSRWLLVTKTRTVESTEPVNYVFVDGSAKPLLVPAMAS